MINNRNILVTGGAGFIGSTICLRFAEQFPDCRITALDNLKRRGSELNLSRLKQAGVRFVHGDVRCAEDLDPGALAPDLILECSAEPSVLAGFSSPAYVLQTNLTGTINCLELARKTQSDFIFLSTSRVYPVDYLRQLRIANRPTRFELEPNQSIPGASEFGVSESFPLDRPRTLYGASKLASELLVAEYADAYGLRTLVNRCGVIAGPWQMGKVDQGVFSLWMAHHCFQKPLSYIGYGGTGKQVRDLLHVDDLVSLLQLQIERLDDLRGETFNVGGGAEVSLSLLETTRICEEISGNRIPISAEPADRPGDVPVFITDCRLVESRIGWKPRFDARRTLESIYHWIRDNESRLDHLK